MNATASAPPLEAAELQASFEAFSRISRSLEDAYERLRGQAAAVDVALAESNRRLQEKVDELDRTRGHLEAVLESLGDAVVATDPEGRLTRVNRAFSTWFRDVDASPGVAATSLCDDAGTPLLRPEAEGELRALQTSHGRRKVRVRCRPITTSAGEHTGRLWTLADETETEDLRERLRQRETLAALGEMAGGVAHELRNPMSAIEGFASMLQTAVAAESDTARRHADRIIRGVRKANAIIGHLLCFARPERFRPHRAPLDAIARAAVEGLVREGARVQIVPGERLHAWCDANLIERVVVNLLENARQAAGPDGQVELRFEARGDRVALDVSDDGPGIPDALRERLFHPFVTGRADGVGLGLALVHRIVDLHGGEIEVHARREGGSTLRVLLPASPTPVPGSTSEETRA